MVESIISATEADWSREKSSKWWEPSRQLLKSIRHYQKWQKQGGIAGYILCRWNVIQHRFWSLVTATDIPLNCQLQGGLLLPHPNGIVIHPSASIGPNCLILQQVTIVADVKIGAQALIGANAVVICDVPPGATAVGIPAKIIEKKTQEV
ncbi:serine acetyltransferase [Microcoleus sp. MON1_C1]|uniref:serine acetyltransferase n=1 Tax=Microcoleus sp. MON1_C1 TaxID=2818827 RepID=UPI002FD2A31E